MIALRNNDVVVQVIKETGANVVKIASLYLITQTMQSKLKEITKDTSQIAAQGLKKLRNKYEEKF